MRMLLLNWRERVRFWLKSARRGAGVAWRFGAIVGNVLLPTLCSLGQENWDFEAGGLSGWLRTGPAFDSQPTFGNNVQARIPGIVINQQGNYWIGTYENRPGSAVPLGTTQGDGPTGTLLSPEFTIGSSSRYIDFLVGGGNDVNHLRVELLVRIRPGEPEPPAVLWLLGIGIRRTLADGEYFVGAVATGRNSEVMRREIWDCLPYIGRTARIRIVDDSSRSFGHINCDDFHFGSESPGDIWITGMEVTQAIQNYPGNSIPLIGGKATLARVYVQSRADRRGSWNDVTARLTVRRGTSGRVLQPIQISNSSLAQPVPVTGSDRNALDQSFNFLLDYDQTVPGDCQLEARIFSISDRSESDPDNNRLVQTVQFNSQPSFTVIGWTYANAMNGPTCVSAAANDFRPVFSAFEVHREWAQNVYPVANLFLVPLIGYPLRSFDNSDCAAYTSAHNWLAGEFDRLFPHGERRGYLFQPESGVDTTTIYYRGWCCNGGGGNQVARGENQTIDPTVFAHEIAHSWGRCHTPDVGAENGCQDFGYPFPDGTVGNQTGVRMGPGGVQTMPPTRGDRSGRGDLMSYTVPGQFISPYTYCGLMNAISGGSLGCPAGAVASGAGIGQLAGVGSPLPGVMDPTLSPSANLAGTQPQLFLYVAGQIHADGSAAFEPFEQIRSGEDITSPSQGASYRLALEDALGGTLLTHLFDPGPGYEVDAGSPTRFSMFVPWILGTARVRLYNKKSELSAERVVTAHAPIVALLDPKAGEIWAGRKLLLWEAKDQDEDPLTFTVYYSSDGGKRWAAVEHAVNERSVEIDFDNLPGSDQAMIRVAASDGVNTAWDQTTAPSVVPRKAPIVTITPPDLSNPERPPVILTGSAFDWEDGPIESPAAYTWRSDRDGLIGQGPWVVVDRLSPGTHWICLSAVDKDLNESMAFATLEIPEKKAVAPDSPPFLGIRVLNQQQVELAWPATARQYVLQVSEALGAAAKWVTVEQSAKDEGYQLSLVASLGDRPQFFRLALP